MIVSSVVDRHDRTIEQLVTDDCGEVLILYIKIADNIFLRRDLPITHTDDGTL